MAAEKIANKTKQNQASNSNKFLTWEDDRQKREGERENKNIHIGQVCENHGLCPTAMFLKFLFSLDVVMAKALQFMLSNSNTWSKLGKYCGYS